ncbi:potassium channel family protein [Thermogemmatispora sp.]|uniref:potassium channel family protein n=1 Tax=Thermogemmatispora sp. TaxID=1968838 RepID=UPI001DEBCF72|nr:potassium channel family protein [Thermogemmatispora sp.]MBX5448900.1 two pore domain potassium channel family protein [Thermogemmatispora sp.]
MSWFVGLGSVVLIVVLLQDAFETVVLPRRVTHRFRLARQIFRVSWWLWRHPAHLIRNGARREYFLSLYGPLSLLFLLVVWAGGLVSGFALLQWSLGMAVRAPEGDVTLGTLFYLSGTTFFTLGLGDVVPQTGPARLVTVVEAGTGFGFLALVLSYLPVIYQAFSRREASIAQLDAHAGSPPSALELLRRHGRGEQFPELVRLLREWERWAAELLESHLSYPVLIYYRSQHERQSWLAALTTLLDACALIIAYLDDLPAQTAWFTFAIARHAAVDLAQIFDVKPRPSAEERLAGDERARLLATLEELGLAVSPERERRLAELRRLYEPYVQSLARHLEMPLPAWAPAKVIDDWQTSPWEHLAANQDAATWQRKMLKLQRQFESIKPGAQSPDETSAG